MAKNGPKTKIFWPKIAFLDFPGRDLSNQGRGFPFGGNPKNPKNPQIQKFKENPTEDHAMINNFIGFSQLSNYSYTDKKTVDRSMITEINGYRTKKILVDFNNKFHFG